MRTDKKEKTIYDTAVGGLQRGMESFSDMKNYIENVDDSTSQLVAIETTEFLTGVGLGCATGYFARRGIKVALVTGGALFVGLQYLNHKKYIDINWKNITQTSKEMLDLNNDGKIDSKDAELAKEYIMKWLVTGVPNAAGFGVGFYAGLKGRICGLEI